MFRSNCISGAVQRPTINSVTDTLARDVVALFDQVVERTAISEHPELQVITSNGKVDRCSMPLEFGESTVIVSIFCADRKANLDFCTSQHLDPSLHHLIISKSNQLGTSETTYSFDERDTHGNSSRYVVSLENGWNASSDIEMEASRWALHVLRTMQDELIAPSDPGLDFSSASFSPVPDQRIQG